MEESIAIGRSIESILRKLQQDQNVFGRSADFMKFVDERGFRPGLRILRNIQEDMNNAQKKLVSLLQFGFKQVIELLGRIIDQIRNLASKQGGGLQNTRNNTYSSQMYMSHTISNITNITNNHIYYDNRIASTTTTSGSEKKEDPWWKKLFDKIKEKALDKVLDRTVGSLIDKIFDGIGKRFGGKKNSELQEIIKQLDDIRNTLKSILERIPAGGASVQKENGKGAGADTGTGGALSRKGVLHGIAEKIEKPVLEWVENLHIPKFKMPEGKEVGGFAKSALKAGKRITKIIPYVGDALSIAGSAVEIAQASPAEKGRTIAREIGGQAGGFIGGAALGAVGAAIGGVPGAFIGGAAGEYLGTLVGEKLGTWIYDKKDVIKNSFNSISKKALDIAAFSGNLFSRARDGAADILKRGSSTIQNYMNPNGPQSGNSSQPVHRCNNTFNITVNGVNKSTKEIIDEIVAGIKSAAGTMGEAAYSR